MRSDSAFPAEILRQALDAAPDGIVVVDEEGKIAAVNRMVEELFGYDHDELVGMSVDLLLPEDTRGAHAGHRAEYATHPRTRSMGSGLDLRARRRSGEEFPVEISLSPLPTDGRLLVVAIIRDVSERRSADEELRRVHEELALVDDRERIARDLHDTVIQRLFAVGLSLQGALTRAASDPVAERIQLAVDEIDVTIRDIRSSIFALHSRRHTGESARDEITAIARDAARVLGFEPSVGFEGPIDTVLTTEIREHMLATLREALSNVTKHAHASHVSIEVVVDGNELFLRVRDDGAGIANIEAEAGNGLPNMRERAASFGGKCEITTPAGGGTQIDWRVSVGANRS
jgi:two-component system sensor histidine kinase DevS